MRAERQSRREWLRGDVGDALGMTIEKSRCHSVPEWIVFVGDRSLPALISVIDRHHDMNDSQNEQRERKWKVEEQPAMQPFVNALLTH